LVQKFETSWATLTSTSGGDSHEGDSSDEEIIIAKKIAKLFRSENSPDPTKDSCSPENRDRVNQLLKRIDHIMSMPPGSAMEALADRGDIVHQVSSGKAKPGKLSVLWNIKQAALLNPIESDPPNAGGDSGSADVWSLLTGKNKENKAPSGPSHAGGDSGPEGEAGANDPANKLRATYKKLNAQGVKKRPDSPPIAGGDSGSGLEDKADPQPPRSKDKPIGVLCENCEADNIDASVMCSNCGANIGNSEASRKEHEKLHEDFAKRAGLEWKVQKKGGRSKAGATWDYARNALEKAIKRGHESI
jgi:hypothetical protein